MNKLLKIAAVAVMAVGVCAPTAWSQQGPGVTQGRGGFYYNCTGIKDANGEAVDDTVWHISALADFDSSARFESITWDKVLVQTKWIGGATLAGTDEAASRDSNNVRFYFLQSINGTNYTLVDSLSIGDTNWNYKSVTANRMPYFKFTVRGLAKIDSAGAAGQFRMCYDGTK